jgi:transcriptional regulator with XRE-family HTH domain
MKRRATDPAVPAGPGPRIKAVRTEHGLSRSQLARASGLRRHDIAAFEEGTAVPTASDLGAIAVACGVGAADLLRPRMDPAFDALLREYLSMVLELRRASTIPAVSLRQEDLTELAKALGGTPELIEARLIELLGTDAEGASELRAAMLPSLTG